MIELFDGPRTTRQWGVEEIIQVAMQVELMGAVEMGKKLVSERHLWGSNERQEGRER